MAAEMANDCGACGEQCSNVHSCALGSVVPDHVVPLHSHVMCSSVVMPINGYYFCGMGCVHAYNSYMVDTFSIDEVMPNEGPGNRRECEFLLPARRRPDAPIELAPEELEEEEEERGGGGGGGGVLVAPAAPAAAEADADDEEEDDEEVEEIADLDDEAAVALAMGADNGAPAALASGANGADNGAVDAAVDAAAVDAADEAQNFHEEQLTNVRAEVAAGNLEAVDGLLCAP